VYITTNICTHKVYIENIRFWNTFDTSQSILLTLITVLLLNCPTRDVFKILQVHQFLYSIKIKSKVYYQNITVEHYLCI